MPVESIPRQMSQVYVSTPHGSGRCKLRGGGGKGLFQVILGGIFSFVYFEILDHFELDTNILPSLESNYVLSSWHTQG